MVIHDNFADFIVFLYIHMSHADNEYHVKEQDMVKVKMKRLFPDTTNAPMTAKYEKALSQYKLVKKEDVIVVIRDSFKHFNSVKPTLKYKVLSDLFDLISADGRIDERETTTVEELKEIMGILIEFVS